MEILSGIIARHEVETESTEVEAASYASTRPRESDVVNFEELKLRPLLSETAKSFRAFCTEVRGLRQLTNRMKTPLSSEGYNYLLEQQVSKVTRSFEDYIKHREELFLYIKTSFWRSRPYGCPQAAIRSGEDESKAAARWIANAS
jgi:hypothetical protein